MFHERLGVSMHKSEIIPLVDLRAQQAEVNESLQEDLLRVLTDASFIGGPDVAAFEAEYADFVGARYCVGVGNGTDALELALRAVGVTALDEVILPANTFVATAEAVSRIGARPVLVDVDVDTLLIDPAKVKLSVTPHTRAVVPVHLYGQVAPVEEVEAVLDGTGIAVVEDAAQSHGASRHGQGAGAIGVAAATSFYPGKNLGAAGDAGAVTTSDPDVAQRIRMLGNHGSPRKYEHEVVGFNSRLDTIQAVVLRHKLRRLAGWNESRRVAAARYRQLIGEFSPIKLPVVDPDGEPVWHLYVVRVPDRDRVLEALTMQGIAAGLHYPTPVHLTQAYRWLGHETGDFPVTERAAAEILSLPMYPHLTELQQVRIVSALKRALSSNYTPA